MKKKKKKVGREKNFANGALLRQSNRFFHQMSDSLIVKQTFYSVLGGVMFGAGWWCLIDGFNMGMSSSSKDQGISAAAAGYAWLCPFGASLFYLMLNAMSWRELDERKVENPSTTTKAKAFLMFSLFISLAVIVGAAFSASPVAYPSYHPTLPPFNKHTSHSPHPTSFFQLWRKNF